MFIYNLTIIELFIIAEKYKFEGVYTMLLSDNDIKRELINAKNIAIYPLKLENIKGSSINLTAGKYAWKTSDEQSAVKDNKIIIPPNDTVCIVTEEAIWVSRRIGGTYHPRVSQVSKGIGHISTTLDPQWHGLSLVAVSNPTSNPIDIRVGDAFVSIMLYYLKTPATKGIIENQASRPDIYRQFHLTDQEDTYLGEQWHRNQQGIVDRMVKSESYQWKSGVRPIGLASMELVSIYVKIYQLV